MKDYIAGLAQRQTRMRHIAESPPVYGQPATGDKPVAERWTKIRLAEGVELSVRE